jgi:hypothetical protein
MATGLVQPFEPIGVVTVAASTTSALATIAPADSVLVFNASAATAFVVTGVVATAASGVPIPAGGRQLFSAGPYVTQMAVILASGTGSVYFTSGNGTAY